MNAKETALKAAVDSVLSKFKSPATAAITTEGDGRLALKLSGSADAVKKAASAVENLSLGGQHLIHQTLVDVPEGTADNQSVTYRYTIELF